MAAVKKKMENKEKGIETSQSFKKETAVFKKKKAIIIAGASLTLLEYHEESRKTFLELSDQVDVVLACRVSPKQKADIVNMIKTRHPKKTTLAIGDGANDVAMIL